jgi:hypothetical protein
MVTRGRCYDFLNIFAEKFSKKNWRFGLKTKLNFEKNYHNIGFWEKRYFFDEKWQKSLKIVIITLTPDKWILWLTKRFFFVEGHLSAALTSARTSATWWTRRVARPDSRRTSRNRCYKTGANAMVIIDDLDYFLTQNGDILENFSAVIFLRNIDP